MNIRWLWGNFIEPQWKLSRADVRKVHRLVHQKYMRPVALYGTTIFWLLVLWTTLWTLHLPLAGLLPGLPRVQAWLVSMIIIIVPTTILAIWSFRFIYTRPIRRAMRELGYDLCINCGYWLHGLYHDVPRCPECGMAREHLSQAELPVEPTSGTLNDPPRKTH